MASLGKSAAVSLVFTLFGGPGILLAYIPWRVTQFHVPTGEPLWQNVTCCTLIFAGLIPLLESIWRFVVVGRGTLFPPVPTEHLVVSGLYAYVRNPMYLGVLTVVAAEAALFRSRFLLEELAWVWLSIELFVRFYEERQISRAFPEEYATYRRNVRRWLPRLNPWHAPTR